MSAATEARVTNGVEDVNDLRELHGDVRKLMVVIGELRTQMEKDQAERRALNWAKRPLWVLAAAAVAIAVRSWWGF